MNAHNSQAEFPAEPDPTIPPIQELINTMGGEDSDVARYVTGEARVQAGRPVQRVEVTIGQNANGEAGPTRLVIRQDLTTNSVSMEAYALMLSQTAARMRQAELRDEQRRLHLGNFPTMFEYLDARDEIQKELEVLAPRLDVYNRALQDVYDKDTIVVEGPDAPIVYEGILGGMGLRADELELEEGSPEREAFLNKALEGVNHRYAPTDSEAR